MKELLMRQVLLAPDGGNNGDGDGNDGSDGISKKFAAMQARLDKLEAAKKKVLETSTSEDEKSKLIKDSQIEDLQAEIESLKASKTAEAESMMENVMTKINLEKKMDMVQESKRDFVKDALTGKTMKEQLAYIDKYAGDLLMPSTQYNGGKGSTGKTSGGESEIDQMMKNEYIIESGLSKDEVLEFMNQDDVKVFERKLMNNYRQIKSTQGVYDFFSKGAKK